MERPGICFVKVTRRLGAGGGVCLPGRHMVPGDTAVRGAGLQGGSVYVGVQGSVCVLWSPHVHTLVCVDLCVCVRGLCVGVCLDLCVYVCVTLGEGTCVLRLSLTPQGV